MPYKQQELHGTGKEKTVANVVDGIPIQNHARDKLPQA